MQLRELSNEEFRQFSHHFKPSSIYQTAEYAFIMNGQNNTSLFLGLIDQGHIIGATLILIEKIHGFKYAYAPRGFLIDYQNLELVTIFTREIKRYLKRKDVMAIKIAPMIVKTITKGNPKITTQNLDYDQMLTYLKQNNYFHMGYNHYFESLCPRFEAIIDLDRPYYEIFQSFKKEVRTKIRSAVNKGVFVYRGNEENLDYLYLQTKTKYPRDLKYFQDCYYFFGKSNMIDYYYTKLNTEQYLKQVKKCYEKLEMKTNKINQAIQTSDPKKKDALLNRKMKLDLEFAHYKKELIRATNLLSEYPEGIVTATILVVKHDDTITVLMDGHDPKFKSFNSKHLLIWQLIERYTNLGYKKFNLGAMSSIFIKENKYEGLNTFKEGFQPTIYEYMGDLELITNHGLYFLYRNAAPIRNFIQK